MLHFIGIGGAGMSGLALVASKLGFAVSGSDRAESSYTQRLREAGIDVKIGHDAHNLPERAQVVVSTAIDQSNPELAAARAAGATVLHRSDLLEEFAARKRCIAISGTHGKTTTTAMIAQVLDCLGADPAYFVGGEPLTGKGNAGWGDGEWVVVEADESDRSLLKLQPEVAVLTNAELDHHSTYASIDDLYATFNDYLASAKQAVVWAGAPLDRLELPAGAILYGEPRPGLAALPAGRRLTADATTYFPQGIHFRVNDSESGASAEVQLGVPGEHNVLNAMAAIGALLLARYGLSEIAAALESFHGVGRRFEHKGNYEGARLYDDYAHHPTEVEATLATARAVSDGRVYAVFQPHLYSRTQALTREFGRALAAADRIVVLDVYPAREDPAKFPGVDGRLIARATAAAAHGKTVVWAPTHERAIEWLRANLRRPDTCVTIGAGDVFKIAEQLAGESGDSE